MALVDVYKNSLEIASTFGCDTIIMKGNEIYFEFRKIKKGTIFEAKNLKKKGSLKIGLEDQLTFQVL